MKKTLQNFGSILSILFLTYYFNLAGFRNCLAEYAVHSLSPWYGLLAALVLLSSVARWCNTTQFFHKNGVILHACVHGRRKEFFQEGPLADLSKIFSTETKSGENLFFTTRN